MKKEITINDKVYTLTESERYGLPVYERDGIEYAVASNDEEADEATKQVIRESLFAFNASFILNFCGSYSEGARKSLEFMQRECCESCNDLIFALICESKFDEFCDEAIAADGRGHFLATYDNEEIELDDNLPYRGGFAYRI